MFGWFGILKYVEDMDEGRQLAMDDDNAQLAAQQMQLIKDTFQQIHGVTNKLEDDIEKNAPDDQQLTQLFNNLLVAIEPLEDYLNKA